jgi:PAS domain S-box-containing protein
MALTQESSRTRPLDDVWASSTYSAGVLAPPKPPRKRALAHRLRGALPTGRSLPDQDWRFRHRALLSLLWLHAPAIFLYALARGFGPSHSLFEGLVVATIAIFATLATLQELNRKICSGLVAFGLLTSSAVIVHISGGYIEAHFHFFVMLSILLLYEDWFPFLLAFAYVVFHHGIAGTLDSTSVYNHADAWANPWKWAAVHGIFISAAGAANIIAWRLNEEVRARSVDAYRQARESEERFRSAFENAPIGVGLQAPSGSWLQVNRALTEILGYSREEIVGLDSHEITHPDDLDADVEYTRGLLAYEIGTYQTERRYFHAKGHVICCLVSASLVRDEAGRAVHLITQVEDITERKRAEQYLEAQRAAASVLAEGGTEDLVFQKLLTALGEAMGWKLGLVWTRNADPGELRFQHFWHAPSVKAADFEAACKEIAFPKGIGLPGLVWAAFQPTWNEDVTKDGNFLRADAARGAGLRGAIAFPVFSAGEVLAVFEFFRTELHQMDRELLGTLDTIARQISQFVERSRAEQEADRLKDGFVALVSHELRSPLTSILGYVDLLREGEGGSLTEEQRGFLAIVTRNSERLLSLVGDLLFVAQVEAGKLNLEFEEVDLGSLLIECREAARPLAEEKGITLSVLAEPLPPLLGDRARLAQLLDNLLSNALKFTPEGGRVEMGASATDDWLVLVVSDSGIGIPEEEQKQLFQAFFRSSSATNNQIPGTGLGLAITKAIAEQHGAQISVTSRDGEGTTFRVEFPLKAAHGERDVLAGPLQSVR